MMDKKDKKEEGMTIEKTGEKPVKEIQRQENTRHAKMPVSQRAKQFMPFAAVTGLDAALLEKEQEMEHLREKFEGNEEFSGSI